MQCISWFTQKQGAVSIRSAEEQSSWAWEGKEMGFGVASTIMEMEYFRMIIELAIFGR
jgi:hypothetical protein